MSAEAAIDLVSEQTLRDVVNALVRLVEAAGAAVIFIGAVIGVVKFLRALPKRDPHEFVPVRLSLGRYLALGLEFQLASDVLRTAVAPTFDELAKLAAVAAIRTALNFFLAKEIREERALIEQKREERALIEQKRDAEARGDPLPVGAGSATIDGTRPDPGDG